MIEIYKRKWGTPKEIKWISPLDDEFIKDFDAKNFDERELEIIKLIDNSEPYDISKNQFKSCFGVFHTSQFSMGIITILNVRMLKKSGKKGIGVDVTLAGENALQVIFEEVKNGEVPILLRHCDIPTFYDGEFEFLAGGKEQISTWDDLFNWL